MHDVLCNGRENGLTLQEMQDSVSCDLPPSQRDAVAFWAQLYHSGPPRKRDTPTNGGAENPPDAATLDTPAKPVGKQAWNAPADILWNNHPLNILSAKIHSVLKEGPDTPQNWEGLVQSMEAAGLQPEQQHAVRVWANLFSYQPYTRDSNALHTFESNAKRQRECDGDAFLNIQQRRDGGQDRPVVLVDVSPTDRRLCSVCAQRNLTQRVGSTPAYRGWGDEYIYYSPRRM